MAEKISDKQVADLATLLRTDASVDSKVNAVTAVKSGIKQHNVPDSSIPQLFEVLRAASVAQHAALANAGFTSLNHLLTRLARQEPKFITKEASRTLPVVVDKMGDTKEKLRTLATQALATMYSSAPMEVERFVRNTAMTGKNPRAKEASMHWLLQMHREQNMAFRSYVPLLMDLLEDADGMVRDVAKSTVIELFKKAPNAAKSDLKRQLKNFKVRPAIEQAIVKALNPAGGAGSRPETPADGMHDPAPAPAPGPARPILAASISSLSSERPITPLLESKPDSLEAIYVNTHRELDEMFRDMQVWFDGRETEQNWLKREESIRKLRKLIVGDVASNFHDDYINGAKGLLDGIIKAITSLRTSLSKEGCALVQEIATAFGPGMDPLVELLMQALLKLTGSTKKLIAQLASQTIDVVLSKVTYNNRLMQHIWNACQDKNVQPRVFATGWLKAILAKEEHHKSHIEHTGGLDLVEKCIKKGLTDPNPGVKEKMRPLYWQFAGKWPARAELIMDNLDGTAQRLLKNDPSNPHSPRKEPTSARPGLGLSKSTMSGAKSSLVKEAMMAQKKAALAAARNLPARPGSAMAHFSPVRTVSSSSTSKTTTGGTMTRQRPESKLAVNSGGMSVAPVRPTRKRPELAARPATAGPYSMRSHDGQSREENSPPNPRTKPFTPRVAPTASPRRTAPRPRPGHATHASESSIPSPSAAAALTKTLSRSPASPRTGPVSPRPSPAMLRASQSARESNSPSKTAEDFSLVVPSIASLKASPPRASARDGIPALPSPILEAGPTVDEGTPTPKKASLQVYEDPFVEDQSTPKPSVSGSVLGDKAVNENAAISQADSTPSQPHVSPEKARQNAKLLDSGITRVKARTLDVHGFRKLQSLIRDNKAIFTDDKFSALLTGLFQYLEDLLPSMAPGKAQDTKAQILATIKLLLRKERENFQPHVARGLEALIVTRSAYDARTHIVAGLEILAEELVGIGDAPELVMTVTRLLGQTQDSSVEGCRALCMGLHMAKATLERRAAYVPSDSELAHLATLATRCLESADSGVRMDAVQLCVAVHTKVGEARFWSSLKGLRDDPKSLITYYVVKRQREMQDSSGGLVAGS